MCIEKKDLDKMEDRILREIGDVKASVDANTRALRGNGGDGGVVGRLIKIETTCMARGVASKKEHKNMSEKNINWIQIMKGFVLPLTVSVLGAVVTAIVIIRVLALN